MILFIQAGTFQGLVPWLIAEPACQFLSILFSFFVLYVRAGSYLSLIIKEEEEETEWLWIPTHRSFFGILATSALSLTLCQHLAKPHHPSVLPKPSQFHCFTRGSGRFLWGARIKYSHPHPSFSLARKGILLCVSVLPGEGRAAQGSLHVSSSALPKTSTQGGSHGWNTALPWHSLLLSPLRKELEKWWRHHWSFPFSGWICGRGGDSWKMGQPSSALETFRSFTKCRNRNVAFFKKQTKPGCLGSAHGLCTFAFGKLPGLFPFQYKIQRFHSTLSPARRGWQNPHLPPRAPLPLSCRTRGFAPCNHPSCCAPWDLQGSQALPRGESIQKLIHQHWQFKAFFFFTWLLNSHKSKIKKAFLVVG